MVGRRSKEQTFFRFICVALGPRAGSNPSRRRRAEKSGIRKGLATKRRGSDQARRAPGSTRRRLQVTLRGSGTLSRRDEESVVATIDHLPDRGRGAHPDDRIMTWALNHARKRMAHARSVGRHSWHRRGGQCLRSIGMSRSRPSCSPQISRLGPMNFRRCDENVLGQVRPNRKKDLAWRVPAPSNPPWRTTHHRFELILNTTAARVGYHTADCPQKQC